MKKRYGLYGISHGYGQIPPKSYSIEAIRDAFSYGCTFFDTAEAYGKALYYEGHNEEILGEALSGIRNQVVIATKFHYQGAKFTTEEELYKEVKGHLVKSLKRLRTDYVDLYYLHRTTDKVPVAEIALVMKRLAEEGLIRGWGLSQVSLPTLKEADDVYPVSAVQNLYNILERDCEKDIFPYCLQKGIGVVPFSPIASGFLSVKISTDTAFEKVDDVRVFVPQLTKENIAANQPVLDILRRYGEEKKATLAQISLAWMLKKYPNCVPIPGSKNKERILENLRASEVILSDEEFDALDAALGTVKVHGHRGSVESDTSTMKDWKR